MEQSQEILIRPAWLYALLNAFPLVLMALLFLFMAWSLSPYFILFSFVVCIVAWYRLLYVRSYRYLITKGFIRITRGLFFKRVDQLEMFRIKDYVITQSLVKRIFKLMDVTLKGTDPENPVVHLSGIPESDLIDIIRERVLQARIDNHIVELN